MRPDVPVRQTVLWLVLCLGLGWALAGCSPAAAARPTVVVTTNILGDITRNVVGDQADVVVLMGANADPHSFGISARQAAVIENADLVVVPLSFIGDRRTVYEQPPARAVLVHDWLWRTHGGGVRVSWLLLKRLNLVTR